MAIIEALWNGNIAPGENCGTGDPEVKQLILLMERHKSVLDKELDEKHRQTFEKYYDCAEEYINLVSMHAFCDGFRLAAKLMAEALL